MPALTVDKLYENNGGMVVCLKHAGRYLAAAVAESPARKSYRTPLGSWVVLTAPEPGLDCETCHATLEGK